MFMADILHLGAGLMMLAGGGAAKTAPRMDCTVPQAPLVRITPHSAPIRYDFSKTSRELDALGRETGANAPRTRDSMTGGLRVDKPEVRTQVRWGYVEETIGGKPTRVCLWYGQVEIDITLNPVIYVASEKTAGACRDAILEHERRHVAVDREVMNRFAADLGTGLKRIVDETGAFGPFPASQRDALGQELVDRVRDTVKFYEVAMQTTMTVRQAEVDSRAEYERISAICNTERARTRR